jgi:hypothetical protein
MSDLTILIAMAFLLVIATFLYFYIFEKIDRIGAQVLTGVLEGTPISMGAREAILVQMWVPRLTGLTCVGAFLAFTSLEIADHVRDANVRMLVYFTAFVFAAIAVGALAHIVAGFPQYRTVLRRAKQRQAKQRQAEAD